MFDLVDAEDYKIMKSLHEMENHKQEQDQDMNVCEEMSNVISLLILLHSLIVCYAAMQSLLLGNTFGSVICERVAM